MFDVQERHTPPPQHGDEQDPVLCLAAVWRSRVLGDTAVVGSTLVQVGPGPRSRTSALACCKAGTSGWGQGALRKVSTALNDLQKSSRPIALLSPAQATE